MHGATGRRKISAKLKESLEDPENEEAAAAVPQGAPKPLAPPPPEDLAAARGAFITFLTEKVGELGVTVVVVALNSAAQP